MFDTKQKYIRLERYNEIIIFHNVIEHKDFKHLKATSAGFCYIQENTKRVICFGESPSLNLKSDSNDSDLVTKQIFGYEAADELQNEKKTQ